jgi:hypothetical protein
MDIPEFRQGKLDTGFIERHFTAEPFHPRADEAVAAILGAAILTDLRKSGASSAASVDGGGPAENRWKRAGRIRQLTSHATGRR